MNFSLLLGSFIQKEFWRALYWKMHDLLFPKQRWLTKVISRTFTDVDDLVQLCLHTCLRQFIEKNNGLLSLHSKISEVCVGDDCSPEMITERQERYRLAILELSDAYKWLQERDAFMSACLKAAEEAEIYPTDSQRRAALQAYSRGCEEYRRRDQLHMESIARHHSLMWL